jgi:hypothetical protein
MGDEPHNGCADALFMNTPFGTAPQWRRVNLTPLTSSITDANVQMARTQDPFLFRILLVCTQIGLLVVSFTYLHWKVGMAWVFKRTPVALPSCSVGVGPMFPKRWMCLRHAKGLGRVAILQRGRGPTVFQNDRFTKGGGLGAFCDEYTRQSLFIHTTRE